MSRLTSQQLLDASLSVDALRDTELLYERMSDISHKFTYFTVNTDLVGVYFLEDKIVVSANGSNTGREWLDNLRIRKSHEGFHIGFYETAVGVLHELLTMKAVTESKLPIEFRGHSRGGYIAITDALFRLQDTTGRETRTITFGSPRLANRKGVAFMEEQGVELHRVHSKRDFVDNLAPRIFGYKHYETEEYAIGTLRWRLDHKAYTEILKAETSCLTI